MRAGCLASIVFLVLVALPRAAAANAHGFDSKIDAVHVANEPDGSVVAVKLSGHRRQQLLRSVERLVTVAVADVDADGDLDILAATIRHGLLLWRNTGRGRFILARVPKARDALAAAPRAGKHRLASTHDEPSEGAPEPVLAPTANTRDPLLVQSIVVSISFSPIAQYRVAPTGRAPPSHT